MKRVLVIGQGADTPNFLKDIANVVYVDSAKHLEDIPALLHKIDLVVFTGGADVDPDLYGHYRHPKNSSTPS